MAPGRVAPRVHATIITRRQASPAAAAGDRPGRSKHGEAYTGTTQADRRAGAHRHSALRALLPAGRQVEVPSREPDAQARCPCRGRAAGPGRPDRGRQVRLDVPLAGPDHPGPGGGGDRRPRSRPGARGLPPRRLGRAADRPHPLRRLRPRGLHRRRGRGGDRGDRLARGRDRARAGGDRGRAAHRHGQCRGRRAGRAAPGRQGKAAGRRLLDGLWRPAGAGGRDGRLGARGRASPSPRPGKGTKYLPALPHRDAGRRLDPLRPDARGGEGRGHEPADVQLLPRRHQVGDRDGGDRQCLRARRAGGRPSLPALRRRRPRPRPAARASWAASSSGEGMVEVVSSLERDGRPVFRDLRWGVYVVLKAPNDYAAACFKQYGLHDRCHRPLSRPCTSPST